MGLKRHKQYQNLINSTKWRNVRNSYISEHPLCEECEKKGYTTPAQCIHHIKPLEDYLNNPLLMQSLAFDRDNLKALCNKCHTQAHIDLKSKSKEATKRRNKNLTELFVKKFL